MNAEGVKHYLNKYEMGKGMCTVLLDPMKEPDRVFKHFISILERRNSYLHPPVAFTLPPKRLGIPDS